MTTNKKKSKRGEKKPKSTPTLSVRELEMLKMARLEQASVLRSRLSTNLGTSITDITKIFEDLDKWVVEGVEITGSERMGMTERIIEWHFHQKIDRYPEVWIRGGGGYGC